jgi:hypothetical protein
VIAYCNPLLSLSEYSKYKESKEKTLEGKQGNPPFEFWWIITADPLIIKIEGVKFQIDLAAEKILGAPESRAKNRS